MTALRQEYEAIVEQIPAATTLVEEKRAELAAVEAEFAAVETEVAVQALFLQEMVPQILVLAVAVLKYGITVVVFKQVVAVAQVL